MILKIFLFNLFGSNSLEGSPKFIETIYPGSTVERLHVVKDAVLQLELRFFTDRR